MPRHLTDAEKARAVAKLGEILKIVPNRKL
jgi:hypothetical protein